MVEATESLASPVSWSHHFIWMVLLVAWLALAEDRPRGGEWYALGLAVLLWAAPYWWVPHGPSVRFAGRGWLLPVGNAYMLVCFVLLLGAAVRVARSSMKRPVRLGRADHGAVRCRILSFRSPRCPGPPGGGRLWPGPGRIGLADDDDRVGTRVEPTLG